MIPSATRGFHHVTLVSTNAQRTVRFYRDLLGLPLVKQTVNFDDPTSYHLYFGGHTGGTGSGASAPRSKPAASGGDAPARGTEAAAFPSHPAAPGTLLTFFEWPSARRGMWGIGGIHHVALGVETAEGQLMWKRRLTDAGIRVSGPYDRGYFKSIYFTDPDGQVLEIATAGPGYAIDEPPEGLGGTLLQPPSERLPSGRDEASIQALSHPSPVPEVTPEMQLQGIHHISGITNDLSRAGDFYEEALGLRLVKKTFNQDDGSTPHFFWAHYERAAVAPRSSLTFFEWPDSGRRARPGAGQTHHIAFRARSPEEQEAWLDHLLSLGLRVSGPADRKYFRSLYFHAPDGLLVELATDGPGFTVDEERERLGETLQLPEWLEPQRGFIEGRLAPLPV